MTGLTPSRQRRGSLVAASLAAGLAGCAAPAVHPLTSAIDPATAPFFSAPWPDDRRLNSDGTISTAHFPNPGGIGGLFTNVLTLGDHLVTGWGLAAPVYMPFSGEIDPGSLPADPKTTSGSVFLLVIDPASPQCGQKNFVDFHYYRDKTPFLPGNVLAVRPLPGFPLLPKTKYALVVTTDVKDVSGYSIGPEAEFSRVLAGTPQGAQEKADVATFQPLIDELHRENFPLSKVAGATVFTTQAVIDEMIKLRDYLLAQPVPSIQGLHIINSRPANENFWLFEGTYEAPHMQHGTLPYVLSGGDFEYDASGNPIPGFIEQMRVAITVPRGPVPAAGYPAFMYSHGTGGDFESIANESGDMGFLLAEKGIVGFGIDQILTGPRAGPNPGTCLGQPVEDCFFDFVNPVAGRNNLRQAALDNIFLHQVAIRTVIPASIVPGNADVHIQSDRIGFIGHSQGGLTGALYAAIDRSLSGAVLSGAGGLLTASVLEREVPDAKSIAEGALFLNLMGDDLLDWYHPALALAQSLAEVVDPLNSARYWIQDAGGHPTNIYMTGGLYDMDTSPDCAMYMAAAAGIPQIIPIGVASPTLALAGLNPIAGPVTNNLAPSGGPAVTAAFGQFPGEGHFPIFEDGVTRDQLSTFMQTLLTTGTATIPPR